MDNLSPRSSRGSRFFLSYALAFAIFCWSSSSFALSSIISFTDPGDGNPWVSYTLQGTYASIGPGGSNQGKWFYVYPKTSVVCVTGVDDGAYTYLHYGEVTGEYCVYDNMTWQVLTIPPVTSCVTGFYLSGGLCSLSPPVEPPPPDPSSTAWSFPQNQLLHVIALVGFFFFGFRQGFTA